MMSSSGDKVSAMLPDPYRYEDPADEMVTKLERGICGFLISASLADHLGDIRDAESKLWAALGYGQRALWEKMDEMNADWGSTFRPTRQLLIDGGYFHRLPDYAQEEPDDE